MPGLSDKKRRNSESYQDSLCQGISLLLRGCLLFLCNTVIFSFCSIPQVVQANSVAYRAEMNQQDTSALTGLVNATFLVLARNSDFMELSSSIRQMEANFNNKYGYPYVILNDEPFSENFKSGIQELTNSTCEFGQVSKDHWSLPNFLDKVVVQRAFLDQGFKQVKYGEKESYHHMCRFYSGFFFKHPLLEKYRYYWRIEPGVTYHCQLDDDPFRFMQENNKTYGFNIAISELKETIPTLWNATKDFIKAFPDIMTKERVDLAMPFLSNDGGDTYSLCHYWSNFEIGDLDFFRGEEYQKYFEFLDLKGGFFMERWGDAPVHTIGVHLLVHPKKIHYFEGIGYTHPPYTNCPVNPSLLKKCNCNPAENINFENDSCCGTRVINLLRSFD